MQIKRNGLNWVLRKNYISAFLFFCLFFFACKKKENITPSFAGSQTGVQIDTTIQMRSVTVKEDSVRTDGVSLQPVGIFNDPVFGMTKCEAFSRVDLTTSTLNFPDGSVADSIALVLAYSDYYGPSEIQHFKLYELAELIDGENEYYSDNKATLGDLITDFSVTPLDTNTDTTGSIRKFRITLPIELANKIISEDNFSSNDEWVNFFNGMAIVPDSATLPSNDHGNIIYLSLIDDSSRMIVYYTASGTPGDYEFRVNDGTPRFGNYETIHTGSEVGTQLGNYDAVSNYAQPLSGVKMRIDFPDITSFDGGLIYSINHAELIVQVADGSDDVYAVPDQMLLVTKEEDGTIIFIPDFNEGLDHFGGELDAASKSYTFNIARYLHDLMIEEKEDRGLFMVVSGSAVQANRAILNSAANSTNKISLKLTYTKLL